MYRIVISVAETQINFLLYFRPPANPSCNNQTRNGTLSPFWEWTANAVFEGDQEIRERVYDLWSYAVGRIIPSIELTKRIMCVHTIASFFRLEMFD